MERNVLSPAYNYPHAGLVEPQLSFFWIGTIIGPVTNFSNLSGTYFNIPLIFSSLLAGILGERLNRKMLLGGSVIAYSAAVVVTGFS